MTDHSQVMRHLVSRRGLTRQESTTWLHRKQHHYPNFFLDMSLLAFSVIYKAQDGTREENHFVALLWVGPLALRSYWGSHFCAFCAFHLLVGTDDFPEEAKYGRRRPQE